MKIEWKAGGAFLMYFAVVYAWAQIYGIGGSNVYYVVGMLSALGLTGAGLWVWITKKNEKEAGGGDAAAAMTGGAAAPTGDAAIDAMINEADLRVSQSSATQGAKIANLPMVFVVGDQGSTKTSALVYSGIEPELLAGAVYGEGNAVASTQHINVWFARGSTFVEAAGKVFADPSKWKALVRRLKPGSWKSIVGKGEQAPRAVLLCYDIENFAKPGAAEQIAAAARYIQARLSDVSDGLGISYPVYILFTRTDRIPFFQEFVRNLSNEEATQVFGSTLALRDQSAGVYAEEETRLLNKAFDDLFYSLADKRCILLPRDGDPAKTPQPYEFPREFRKLRQSMVQFMVDCCRPSQLKASPFLRGFYFAGVRPITVSAAPVVQASKQEEAFKQAGAATQMFSAAMLKAQMQQAGQAGAQQQGRRVPQWLFLGHLFNDILLKDSLAMGASGSSVKTSFMQRLLLGLAAGLFLLYAGGLTVSFFRNQSLENQAINAAKGLADVRADMKACEAPSLDQLQRLETLRQTLLQLTDYETNGAPLTMRLGLYAGSDMYPEVRKSYYDRFKALLFGGTQQGLVANMKRYGAKGKPEPTDSFETAYDDVKAHLLTTKEYERVKGQKELKYGDFVGRTLHNRWECGKGGEIGNDRTELARKQFMFYGEDLANGNPYSKVDDGSRPAAQAYLREFSGEEAALLSLLSKADAKGPTQTFNQWLPKSGDNVRGDVPVRFGFTKKGYEFMNKELDTAKFGDEPWVMGEGGIKIPIEELRKRVRERYAKSYIEVWRNVMKKAAFVPYGGLGNAKDRLPNIAGGEAPIPGLFWWTSNNTNIDLAGVKQAFASVQAIQPPSEAKVFNAGQLQNYSDSLRNLVGPIDAAIRKDPDSSVSAQNLTDQKRNAENITRGMASAVPMDAEAALHTTILDLMLRPIVGFNAPRPGGEWDDMGAAFCSEANQLQRKFPFSPKAIPEVSETDLETIFKPGGRLTKLVTDLQPLVACSSVGQPNCQKSPTGKLPIRPDFLSSLNQMLQLQRALYPDGQNLNYKFTIKPTSEFFDKFILTVGGDRSPVAAGGRSKTYSFNRNTGLFQPTIFQKGNTAGQDVQGEPGFWSVFRFFAKAETPGPKFTFYLYSNGRRIQFEGRDLTYDFTVETDGPPIFSKELLQSIRCVPTVVQK